jgi:hypothetical protein
VLLGLIGAAIGATLNSLWGTLIGFVFGIWVATKTEEYKIEKIKLKRRALQ